MTILLLQQFSVRFLKKIFFSIFDIQSQTDVKPNFEFCLVFEIYCALDPGNAITICAHVCLMIAHMCCMMNSRHCKDFAFADVN